MPVPRDAAGFLVVYVIHAVPAPRHIPASTLVLALFAICGWLAAGVMLVLWQADDVDHVARRLPSGAPAEPPPPSLDPPPDDPAEAETPWPAVAEALAALTDAPGFEAAQIGFVLIDAGGDVALEHDGWEAQIPASTLKSVTAATALERLGPGYRFETRIAARSRIDRTTGTLHADLILAGGGDPTLSRTDLDQLAALLVSAGLKKVSGAVVGDAGFFHSLPAGDFWNVGDVGNAYGAGVFGLNLEQNAFRAIFAPGEHVGDPATFVGSDRIVAGATFRSDVATGPPGSGDRVMIYSEPFADQIVLRGSVPLDEPTFKVGGAVPDPPRTAAAVLADALERRGVMIDGDATSDRLRRESADAPPPAAGPPVTLAAHQSDPLAEIVRHLMEVSDNVESHTLFLLLGKLAGESPENVIVTHWRERGWNLDGLRMEDGSGLARANHIRPIDLAAVNFLSLRGPAAESYGASLNRHFNGRAAWKGGAMSSVRSWVGFAGPDPAASPVFAIMFNHYDGERADTGLWRDRLIAAILQDMEAAE